MHLAELLFHIAVQQGPLCDLDLRKALVCPLNTTAYEPEGLRPGFRQADCDRTQGQGPDIDIVVAAVKLKGTEQFVRAVDLREEFALDLHTLVDRMDHDTARRDWCIGT